MKERGKRGLAGLVLNQQIGSVIRDIETMAEGEGGGGAHIYERNSKKAGTPSLIKEGHLVSWIFPNFIIFFFFFSSIFFPHPFGNVSMLPMLIALRGGWRRVSDG